MKTAKSEKLFKEAREVLVDGVNSPVRSFESVGGEPLVMRYGEKARLCDQDGNFFTDYCLSWGALILGHAHRNVVLAAKKTVERGLSFGTTTSLEIDLAKYIAKCVPSIEKIRFVNSGTEATMSAIRLARGFTKRDMIVKFDGCYHGHFDDLLAKAGSGVAQLSESSSLGVPQSHIKNTFSLPYNDTAILAETLEKFKDKIACVIIEPVAGNMGVVCAKFEFLKNLRELTAKYNIVLIFDEVMSGFRSSSGGVQGDLNIIPDITCLGKIIGGGFPIGAYGGRKDIMGYLSPLGGVYQAGTFSGNPVVMAAGLAALKLLSREFYENLNKRCTDFVLKANTFLKENKIKAHFASYHSMLYLWFSETPVFNYQQAQQAAGNEGYAKLFHHLLKNGIYWPPAPLETFFVSGMHTQKDLDDLLKIIRDFFSKER